jgi:hypothetical protein
LVGDAGPVGEFVVGDRYPGGAGLQFCEAGHVSAVDAGGISEVAATEPVGFAGEVLADRGELVGVILSADRHGLLAARVGLGEGVDGPVEIEGHHLRAVGRDFGLAGARGLRRSARRGRTRAGPAGSKQEGGAKRDGGDDETMVHVVQ